MEELKPCPFCGGEARLSRAGTKYIIFCPNCVRLPADGGFIRQEDAVAAWNNRTDNWISVEERLPKIGDFVNVGLKSGNVGFAQYNGMGFIITVKVYSQYDVVTHWQPLPQPPKSEKGE